MAIEQLINLTQPALAYNWEVEVRAGFIADVNGLKFRARSANIPDSVTQPIEIPYKGWTVYFPGRDGSAHTTDLVFWDGEDLAVYKSLARWREAVQSEAIGRAGRKSEVLGTVEMRLLTPDDDIIGTWVLINAWPESLQPIALDYTANDAVTVTVTFRFDYCQKPL